MSLLSVIKTGGLGGYVPWDNHHLLEKRRSSWVCKTNAFIYLLLLLLIIIIIIIIDNKK